MFIYFILCFISFFFFFFLIFWILEDSKLKGPCVFSASIRERIQPKRHLLFGPHLKQLLPEVKGFLDSTPPNVVDVESKGVNAKYWSWSDYSRLFTPGGYYSHLLPYQIPRTDPRGDPNTDILLIGTFPNSRTGVTLFPQILGMMYQNHWIYTFGRVRTLIWVDSTAVSKFRSIDGPFTTASKILQNTVTSMKLLATNCIENGDLSKREGAMFLSNDDVIPPLRNVKFLNLFYYYS